MSTNIFSSLSGNYDYMSSMSGLLGDYASIKNGSYGSLMKSYVNKVGNKAALNAYRETGSTTVADTASSTSTAASTSTTKTSSSKSSFLDSHLSSVSSSGHIEKSETLQKLKEAATQYDKDANKTTVANTPTEYDTTI